MVNNQTTTANFYTLCAVTCFSQVTGRAGCQHLLLFLSLLLLL